MLTTFTLLSLILICLLAWMCAAYSCSIAAHAARPLSHFSASFNTAAGVNNSNKYVGLPWALCRGGVDACRNNAYNAARKNAYNAARKNAYHAA